MSDVPWAGWVLQAARARAEEVRSGWRERERAGGVHAEIDAILRDDTLEQRRRRGEPVADPRLDRLAGEFGLGVEEREFLALLAIAQADPRWSRVLGYLEDDLRPRPVTPAVAAALWGWAPGTVIGPASALVTWGVAGPADERDWLPTAPWVVDPAVVAYLCGGEEWWTFRGGMRLVVPEFEVFYPEVLADLVETVRMLDSRTTACEIELVGQPGSGRRTLLCQLALVLKRRALLADPALGMRALGAARLLDAVPIFADPGEPPIDPAPGRLTFVARERPAAHAVPGTLRISRHLPDLDRDIRLSLWSERAPGFDPPPAVREWTLTPAQVISAAAAAPAGPHQVAAAARRSLGGGSGSLLSPVPCPYTWNDLVLGEPVRTRLRDLESQVRLRGEVLDAWDFHRLTPTSRGATALFAGPSGTGKTMAAQVLARSLDLELFRVDLAQVVDKYIGETEKRLARVFDECERCQVLVLFDEADALFGQRTRVKDAHDRFANIEIDYLLQRMESFDGVAILATNRKGDLDQAFLRRLRMVVDFSAPAPAERLRLWELALPRRTPSGTPVSRGVDRRWLAQAVPLTGAEIKAVTLAAAYLARGRGELIGMEHVLAAARDELAKRGSVLRVEPPGGTGSAATDAASQDDDTLATPLVAAARPASGDGGDGGDGGEAGAMARTAVLGVPAANGTSRPGTVHR